MRRLFPQIVGVVLLLLLAGLLWYRMADEGPEEPISFDGDSANLQHTAIVPTLDTPIPEGQSAVWCASLQLAWDKLKTDVIKGPVQITNRDAVCDRLNKASPVESELPAEGFFAAAGFTDEGIVDTIRKRMTARFPHVSITDLEETPDGIVAYAYLEASVRYGAAFRDNSEAFQFPVSGAASRAVKSFGIPLEGELDLPGRAREQVAVLYTDEDERHYKLTEFAVDLDQNSVHDQIVLARLDRKSTLGETLSELEEKMRRFASQGQNKWFANFGINDTLIVPNMNWNVHHQFKELLGPGKNLMFNGRKYPIVKAEQTIKFHVDAHGAGVASKAEVYVKSGPRHFEFNRPFLLYLKKRDAKHPFFVMWVENAELLSGSGW